MDLTEFNSPEDSFPVLDLVAKFEFKTFGSVSFRVGKYAEELLLGDGTRFEMRNFAVCGWVDVHHPCNDHIKARLICRLPGECLAWEKQNAIVDAFFAALGIPTDETFEATFLDVRRTESILQSVDRDGFTDTV